MTVRDELAVAALAKALVRTGMYVDAGIDTSAGLDKPQVYAAAILNDRDLAADGLHFVMVETLERAATPTASPTAGGDYLVPTALVASPTAECKAKSDDRWVCETHGGYIPSQGPPCSTASPTEDES